jgi:hypothetical protein
MSKRALTAEIVWRPMNQPPRMPGMYLVACDSFLAGKTTATVSHWWPITANSGPGAWQAIFNNYLDKRKARFWAELPNSPDVKE